MEILIQLITILAPVIITGLITFFITKYACDKNVPLDKIEIAYNRIYYPINKLLRSDNVTHLELQSKMDFILLKYDKYLSQSTRLTYMDYKNDMDGNVSSNKNVSSDKNLATFKQNIFEYNSKYRKILGYPQANGMESFRYMKYIHKVILIALIMFVVMYTAAILYFFIQLKIIMAVIGTSAISVLCLMIFILGHYIVAFVKMKIKRCH